MCQLGVVSIRVREHGRPELLLVLLLGKSLEWSVPRQHRALSLSLCLSCIKFIKLAFLYFFLWPAKMCQIYYVALTLKSLEVPKLGQWAQDWEMEFDSDKCEAFHFGKTEQDRTCTVNDRALRIVVEQ